MAALVRDEQRRIKYLVWTITKEWKLPRQEENKKKILTTAMEITL